MSEASKAIDAFLRQYLDPGLRDAGFKKSRRRYVRAVDGRIELVNVEASTWNYSGHARFEISVAIYIPELATALGRVVTDPAKVRGYECGITETVRRLMKGGHQFAGLVSDDSIETDRQGRLLESAIQTRVLPWFTSLREASALVAYMRPKVTFPEEVWRAYAAANSVDL